MASSDASIQRWRHLFFLFFASGISGLIYESIWSRYIKQLVGSASTAQILVLSLFMGGMSVGALLAGRYLHRVRRPVIAYGIIEGLIGLYALAFPHLFGFATRLAYDVIFPALGGGMAVGISKWVIAGTLILPPCLLLGTTFPLMSVGILRREPVRGGEVLAALYFSNSLGASLGAVLSGFALVPRIGLPGALMVAAALNIGIMLVALRDREPTPPIVGEPLGQTVSDRTMVWLYLAVAGGTGLSSFMYEIGWIRLLSMILGSATHSFEVMLSAFVMGLALGGFWVRKRMDRFRRPELVLAIVQLIMGASAIITLPAYEIAVYAMGYMMGDADRLWWVAMVLGEGGGRSPQTWLLFNILRYLLCLVIMLPATFCAGMTLPLLTHVMLRRGQPEAVVGNVYGVNTLGAIVGAISAGLILMPIIRLQGVIVVGALVDMLLGLSLIRGEIRMGRGNADTPTMLYTAALGSMMMIVAGLFIRVDPMVLTSTVFRKGRTRLPDKFHVISYVDGRTASVTVVDNEYFDDEDYFIIYTNGKPDASVILNRFPEGRDPRKGPAIAGDEPNQFLVGLLPLMVKPDAAHGALIGFGSGVTCHTVLGSPVLERLDTIEIEPEMVRGAEFFKPINYRAYLDERSHIHFDDAKAYFAAAGDKYDFIISEPTNPWVSGVSSLFTVEFYREAKRYLKPGGILAQWIQGYELSDELMISVMAAIDQEFEDYLVIRIGSLDWVILSSPDGPIGPLDSRPLEWEQTRASFDTLGIHTMGQIDGLITANRRILHPFLVDKQPNSDALPLLDAGAERERFLQSAAEFMHEVRFTPAPVLEVMGGIHRRPYPKQGIGDLRDPHILEETEQAVLLMRRYADGGALVAEELSAAPMNYYKDAMEQLDDEPSSEAWAEWVHTVYVVYTSTVAHIEVHQTPWWAEVKQVAAREGAPEPVVLAVQLMDALSAKDGARLWPLVQRSLAMGEETGFVLPMPLRTVAGAIALELLGAPAEERHAFVDEWMARFANGTASDELAYQVIRAYAKRP